MRAIESLDFAEQLVRDQGGRTERAMVRIPRDDTDVRLAGIHRQRRLGDPLLDVGDDVRRVVEKRPPEQESVRVKQVDHVERRDADIFPGPLIQLLDVGVRSDGVPQVVQIELVVQLPSLVQDGSFPGDRLETAAIAARADRPVEHDAHMADLPGDMMLPVDQLAAVDVGASDAVPGVDVEELVDADRLAEIEFAQGERPHVVLDEDVLVQTLFEFLFEWDVMQVEARREQDDPIPRLDHPVDGHPEPDDIAFSLAGQFYVKCHDGLDELLVRVEPLVMPCLT